MTARRTPAKLAVATPAVCERVKIGWSDSGSASIVVDADETGGSIGFKTGEGVALEPKSEVDESVDRLAAADELVLCETLPRADERVIKVDFVVVIVSSFDMGGAKKPCILVSLTLVRCGCSESG